MLKKLLAATVGALALAALTAAGGWAASGASSAFLCYSTLQPNPGVFSLTTPTPQSSSAQMLLDQGSYWSPFAETTVPTGTQITGGYYLDCQLPVGMAPTGQVVGLAGTVYPGTKLSGQAGFYPLATTVATPLPMMPKFPIPPTQ